MTSLKRTVIISRLARLIRDRGNWCGETHLQKAMFLLQELAGVDAEFEFVLYLHGPFSFQLRDELNSMRADELLELEIQKPPYGPKLVPTDHSRQIESKFPNTLAKHNSQLEFVAEVVGDKGVAELERLATALFITRREATDGDVQVHADRLHSIKPHISVELAREAVKTVDGLIKRAAMLNC